MEALARLRPHHPEIDLPRLDRLELGTAQVLGTGEDQGLGLDRRQRLGGVAVEAGRGADVVPVIGPGLVDPTVGVERRHKRRLLLLHRRQHVSPVLELGHKARGNAVSFRKI